MKIKNSERIVVALVGASSFLMPLFLIPLSAIAAEVSPRTVVDEVYAGAQFIHDYQGTPDLIFADYDSACGTVLGSGYCPAEHRIFLTYSDVEVAYE
jgi:uncharacterized protein